MRVRVTIDDDLLTTARELTGVHYTSELIHMALEELVARESAHRLAELGGTEPDLTRPPRRRPEED